MKKLFAILFPVFLAAIIVLSTACGTTVSEQPKYGDPVFGTVTESSPVVKTLQGKVRGENREGVAVFRGIPYGANVDGEGRFLPAKSAPAWEGVRDCTKNGPIAMQNGGSISDGTEGLSAFFNGGHRELFITGEEVQSENCLVLDVLSPGLDDAKRPVVVYTHGGGFSTGSGTLTLGSDKWAREENIVVVGVNHRLNVFGYLYLGDLDPTYASSGVAGMLDLVLALQWVRDNIASFGGNPDDVTIMGESGGGMKVSTLMTMPAAKGLFHKAIVESGSNVTDNYSKAAAAAQAEQLLKNLGISKTEWKKLLSLPAADILAASAMLNMSPVADDINLPYSDNPAIKAYEISKDIPLLVGSSADEMGVFMPVSQLAQNITADNLKQTVAQTMRLPQEQADKLVDAYESINYKHDAPWHTYIKISSLSSFLGGGAFSQAMAKAEQGGAPVYHYLIEYDTPSPAAESLRCAWHTADLPLQMRIVLYPEQEEWSKTMAHAWAAFIRTGNPSTEQLQWPAFTAESQQVMVFDNDGPVVKVDPLKAIREVAQ